MVGMTLALAEDGRDDSGTKDTILRGVSDLEISHQLVSR